MDPISLLAAYWRCELITANLNSSHGSELRTTATVSPWCSTDSLTTPVTATASLPDHCHGFAARTASHSAVHPTGPLCMCTTQLGRPTGPLSDHCHGFAARTASHSAVSSDGLSLIVMMCLKLLLCLVYYFDTLYAFNFILIIYHTIVMSLTRLFEYVSGFVCTLCILDTIFHAYSSISNYDVFKTTFMSRVLF